MGTRREGEMFQSGPRQTVEWTKREASYEDDERILIKLFLLQQQGDSVRMRRQNVGCLFQPFVAGDKFGWNNLKKNKK